MGKLIKVPLIFLFIGSLLGAFLRLQFISTVSNVNYSYFLHAHSHVMFLGWIVNIIFIAFIINQDNKKEQVYYRKLFVVMQLLVVGMLISFPLQGYGFFSILFSTMHTICVGIFTIKYLSLTRNLTSISVWYARVALLFFLISTAGPISLGYLMASGLGQSNWYYFSLYFYLHFQYNGFFLFAVFSVIFDQFESAGINFSIKQAKQIGGIFAVTCFPAYLLSTLWAEPDSIYYVIAGLAAWGQLIGLVVLCRLLFVCRHEIKLTLEKHVIYFLAIAMAAFILKLLLQFMSSFPSIAQMAYQLRPVTIGYLHLVLLGVISLPLLVWILLSGNMNKWHGKRAITLYIFFFTCMEACIVASPWWHSIFGSNSISSQLTILLFSTAISLCCLWLMLGVFTARAR